MTVYVFKEVRGTAIAFDPAVDRLVFGEGSTAEHLEVSEGQSGIRVHYAGSAVDLPGLVPSALNGRLIFGDGSSRWFGSTSSDALAGGEGDDWFELAASGGNDTVSGGGGDDKIRFTGGFGPGDRVDGGAGTADTLEVWLQGDAPQVLDGTRVTGVENIVLYIPDGPARVVLQQSALSAAAGTVTFSAYYGAWELDGRATDTGFQAYGYSENDTLRGGSGADRLVGDFGADTLHGGAGADTLDGGAGADRLAGGQGADRFVFGFRYGSPSSPGAPDRITDFEASDRMEFVDARETEPDHALIFNAQALAFDRESMLQQDTKNAQDGFKDIYWQRGADGTGLQVWVDYNDDGMMSAGDFVVDVATASPGKVSMVAEDFVLLANTRGTGAAESLAGSAADDFIGGAGGNDTLRADAGNDTLFGDSGNDRLYGAAGSDVLDGGDGNDRLYGDAGSDTLGGGAGNDTLDAGSGTAGLMAGGAGSDTYVVRSAGVTISEAYVAGANTDTDQVWSHVASYTLGDLVENGTVKLATGARLAGNWENNLLVGGAGNDTLSGEIGDDRLDGGGGADELVGGEESDTYVIRDARARVIEAAEYGRDTVESHLATYTLGRNVEDGVVKLAGGGRLQGNSGSNGLAGSVGADTLLGGKGNDRLDGGAGSDSMEGGIGNDTYYIDDAGDRTVEAIASGTDTIVSTISRKLGAHLENLTLSGSASLKGSGNELDNVLRGNDGANVLDGGSGDDRIFGGLGNDTYVLDSAEDRILEEADSGVDTVVSGVNRALGDHQENLTLSGTASRGKGNDLSNVLQGNGGANRLDGGAGDDTLRGGNGDDTYYTDTVGDLIVEALTGGIDTVISTVAGVTLARYVENLTLLADAWFGTGNDQANVLRGTAHANRLDGGRGADTLEGGAGDDTYGVDNARDRVVESANGGRDTVVAVVDFRLGAHIETLVLGGSAAIDGTGNSGANRLRGNAAANVLDGGLGVDTMEGGRGDDTYHVDRTRDEVVEEPGGGHDTVVSTVDYTLGLDVDNLSLAGAALVGRGNEDANVLRGTAAANTLDGDQGADTLIGGAGDDRYRVDDVGDVVQELKGAIGGIDTVVSESRSYTMDAYIENLVQSGFGVEAIGNALANHMTGSASDNILDGGLGADTLVGGEGSDTYVIDSQDVVVEGKSARGQDTIITDLDWTLSAVMENLQLVGTGGLSGTGNGQANLIRGNAGANVLDGLGGADTLEGGQGNDTYYVEGDADFVREVAQGGIDVVIARGNFWLGQHVENLTLIDSSRSSAEGFGNELDNVLTGGAGGNWLDGYEGDDTIAGGAGADYVWGEGGHDRLLGGDGADRLVGGAGKDKLSGGAGSDRFVYDSVSNSPNGASDVITDFVSGVDKLDFRTQNSHDGEPSLESIAFIGSRGFDGDASGQLRYAYDAASRSVMLYGSDDADSHAEFAVQLLGISSLNESDFLFPVH